MGKKIPDAASLDLYIYMLSMINIFEGFINLRPTYTSAEF